MNSQDANRIRGLMSVLDSELEGSRRMIGAMLIQSFAEMLDAESASKIVEEIGASLVRACQIVQAELDEPVQMVFERNVRKALADLVAMGRVEEPTPGYFQLAVRDWDADFELGC